MPAVADECDTERRGAAVEEVAHVQPGHREARGGHVALTGTAHAVLH